MSCTKKDPDFLLPKPTAQGLRGREHAAAAFLIPGTSPLAKTAYGLLGVLLPRAKVRARLFPPLALAASLAFDVTVS